MLADEQCALILTRVTDNEYNKLIKKFVSTSNIKDNILLLPNLPREQMLAIQNNAHIGITFVMETTNAIKTQMIAPNKIGEYLASNLFLVGSDVAYMKQFEAAGVAVLTKSLVAFDIAETLKLAKSKIEDKTTLQKIMEFTINIFSMQQQLLPVTEFLKKLD